jgi:hypothetical protein
MQGHVPGSGLQKHSIGADYPWLVFGVGNGDRVDYRVMNCETGETLPYYCSTAGLAQWFLDTHLGRKQ